MFNIDNTTKSTSANYMPAGIHTNINCTNIAKEELTGGYPVIAFEFTDAEGKIHKEVIFQPKDDVVNDAEKLSNYIRKLKHYVRPFNKALIDDIDAGKKSFQLNNWEDLRSWVITNTAGYKNVKIDLKLVLDDYSGKVKVKAAHFLPFITASGDQMLSLSAKERTTIDSHYTATPTSTKELDAGMAGAQRGTDDSDDLPF